MSYYTRVHIFRDDEHDAPTETILDAAREYVRKRGWHEDIIADLRESLERPECDGATVNKLWCQDIEGMMLHLSQRFPAVWFGARGFGEEFRDIWIREFQGGQTTFAQGPFDEE
jgi:hypothetical protein